MGVYHVSGLGTSPGALTMPLSIVYILQAAAQLGNSNAKAFFAGSGEMERKGSYEKIAGLPEYIIAFDSPEVIHGKMSLIYESKWFRMRGSKQEPIERPIVKYLTNLVSYLNDEFNVCLKLPKKLFLIETNYQDFEDSFEKMGITLEGLRRKEVWLNLIGGSNQMNLALLLSGSFTAIPSRYYYVFQNTPMLEPSWIQKPNKSNIATVVKDVMNRWYDLPPLDMGLGSIIEQLYNKFIEERRDRISKNELVQILKHKNPNYSDEFIPKLIRARYLVSADSDTFAKGDMLDRVLAMFGKIVQSKVHNFSNWQKWAKEQGILKEVSFDEVSC